MSEKRRPGIYQLVLALMLGTMLGGPIGAGESEGRDYFRSPAFVEPMRSVELQYFRIPRERWDLLLIRMAQYNADTISTYVHWGFHEYEEGRFDFTGQTLPERDLVGFIELCEKHGLKVVLKPGPFIDAETNAGGIPRWLFETYPETIAINRKGKPFIHGDSGMPRISYLHPKYLELVERYYQELGRALARWQWPEGPIIAVQVDNETPGDGFVTLSNYLTYNFKADYNAYYVEEGWPEWLKEKYGTIENLNQVYGSSYASFKAVPMLSEWGDPKSEKEFQLYVDLDQFAEYQYVEGLRRMTAMLREAGFYAPTYQDLLCMPWDMAGLLGDVGGMAEAAGGWIGSNVYAEVYRPWTYFVGGPGYGLNWDEYVHMGVWRTRLAGTLSEPYPAFVPEITCSRRFYFQAPIAHGADAVNIYVGWQTPVDNELVAPRGSWGMEACVSAEGEVRDCFWNGKNTFLFMERSGGFLPGAEPPEVALGYSHKPEHAWNWEFKFNFGLPHTKVRHPELESLVRGTNIGDRTQLIAREFVARDYEFDVLHMDHIKPGQLERYKLVIVPVSRLNPAPEGERLQKLDEDTQVLYLAPGDDQVDVAAFEKAGVKFLRAWADSEEVDVTERAYGPGRPAIIAVVNRGRKTFNDPVFFDYGARTLRMRLGGKAIGFASVKDNGLVAAVIDHKDGLGEVNFGEDRLAFTGTFATIVAQPDYALVSAVDSGEAAIKSGWMKPPTKLYRLFISGRVEEAGFKYENGTLHFSYQAGAGADRTDLYVALASGVTIEDALGGYLSRTKREK